MTRLPRLADLIRWYAEAGLDPVVVIEKGKDSQKITIRSRTANDDDPSQSDPLADDIERAFGGRE